MRRFRARLGVAVVASSVACGTGTGGGLDAGADGADGSAGSSGRGGVGGGTGGLSGGRGGSGGSGALAGSGGSSSGGRGGTGALAGSGGSSSGGTGGVPDPACLLADTNGFFADCTACFDATNCDGIDTGASQRSACGCTSDGDCPCGLTCGCYELAPGANACGICVR